MTFINHKRIMQSDCCYVCRFEYLCPIVQITFTLYIQNNGINLAERFHTY